MIPFGPVYRDLRSLMLSIFPQDSPAAGPDGVNFSQWIDQGAYVISRHDAKRVYLAVSPHDLATALGRDVEFLVDSCFEQLLEILTLNASLERSPSWGVVTCYYYAFFASQALSRIIGRPVTYLDDSKVSTIKRIYSVPITLGAGSFSVLKSGDLSASQAEFSFEKSKLRPHDAVWKCIFHLLADLKNKHKPSPRSPDLAATQEFQLFETLTSHLPFRAFPNGSYNWPSDVRYEANYRVGNAYKMLRKPWHLHPQSSMSAWKNATTESILSSLKQSLTDFETGEDISGLKSRASFMLDAANTIFAIVRRLQFDLHGRRRTDRRWEERRRRFTTKHNSLFAGMDPWLFPTSL